MFKKLLTQVGLGGLPSSFGFTVGEKVELPFRTIWSLHKGQKRSDGTLVSVFVYNKKELDVQQLAAAKNAEQVSKSLRHPNVLRALDSCDVEDALYLVTEAIVPLLLPDAEPAEEGSNNEPAVWGLYQALDALSFLHQSGFSHGMFGPAAIFVTPRGDYRLGGFELCRKGPEASSSLSAVRRCGPSIPGWPEPPSKLEASGMPTIAFDLWGAALLEAYVFGLVRSPSNGVDYRPDLARGSNDLPTELRKIYAELQNPGPLRGKSPIAELITHKFFQEHTAVKIMLFLSGLHIKSAEEKEAFFESLTGALDSVPIPIQKRQVLPDLLQAQKFPGLEGAQVLPAILKIGARLSQPEFRDTVAPLVVQLFASPDRAIRFRLLSSIGDMVENLDDSMINDKIFPECVNGFTDSNGPIREATVKSLIFFVPRLRAKLLEGRVIKLLVKLLQDPEPSIRTNTVICCGRISSHLPQAVACQMLMQALTSGMNDGFAPCRSATLHTLLATAVMFGNQELACRLLPLVCQRLVDPDPGVGDTAFEVLASLQQHLRTKVSESRVALSQEAAAGVEAASTDNQGQPGAWGSWMSSVGSAMGSKIMGSMASKSSGSFSDSLAGATTPQASATELPTQANMSSMPAGGAEFTPARVAATSSSAANSTPLEVEDSFWDEFDDVVAQEKEVLPAPSQPAAPKAAATHTAASNGWTSKEEDDFWKEFDA